MVARRSKVSQLLDSYFSDIKRFYVALMVDTINPLNTLKRFIHIDL